MKRKINSINGKRLVIGNANELTKDEILVQQTKEGTVSLKERVGGELKELTSSGGVGGSDVGEELEYLDVSGYDFTPGDAQGIIFRALCIQSACMKVKSEQIPFMINTYSIYKMLLGDDALNILEPVTVGFVICPNMKIQGQDDEGIKVTTIREALKDTLSEYGMDYDAIPRMTEEEFYNLEA